MSKTFFISDTHFYHKNIIKYENRPFKDVEDMNSTMIEKWNKKVKKEDTVYIIGDFAFIGKEKIAELCDKLNGIKHLIIGNHDEVNYSDLANPNSFIYGKFKSVFSYKEIKLEDKIIVMCHYPFLTWNKSHHGSIHLFGHVHSNYNSNHPMREPSKNSYNVGADINNYEPCELEEIIENNKVWKENYPKKWGI